MVLGGTADFAVVTPGLPNDHVLIEFRLRCRFNLKKLTYEERKAKLIERLNALNASADANEDEDDE